MMDTGLLDSICYQVEINKDADNACRDYFNRVWSKENDFICEGKGFPAQMIEYLIDEDVLGFELDPKADDGFSFCVDYDYLLGK